MYREIVLDTETTGFEPSEGHRLVEIGCLELINHIPTGKTFHVYINPERDVPAEAVAVHGLDRERLKDEPLFAQVAQDFLDFIQNDPLVIHNAKFDMKFLNAELLAHDYDRLPDSQALDTLAMARKKFPGAQASLDALCRRFGIDNSNRTLHGALLDSELLAEVYLNLIGGRQPNLLGGGQSKETKKTDQVDETLIDLAPKRAVKEGRSFPPSEDELAVHKQFLEELSEPIWDKYTSNKA